MDIKLIGKYKSVYLEDENKFVRFCDCIIYENREIPEFEYKLRSLGFVFKIRIFGMVHVQLPADWFIVKLRGGIEYIIDDQGRKRLVTDNSNKKTDLIRRFGYGFDTSIRELGDDRVSIAVTMYILDQEKIVHKFQVPSEEFPRSEAPELDDSMLEYIDTGVKLALQEKYPNWEDETAYW